jgi:hypothetical protein
MENIKYVYRILEVDMKWRVNSIYTNVEGGTL